MSTRSSPESVPDPGLKRAINKWAWLLALSHVVVLLVECVIAQFTNLSDDANRFTWLVVFAATLPIAVLDSESLQKAGVRLSAFWWLLFPPLYLLMRAIKLRWGYLCSSHGLVAASYGVSSRLSYFPRLSRHKQVTNCCDHSFLFGYRIKYEQMRHNQYPSLTGGRIFSLPGLGLPAWCLT